MELNQPKPPLAYVSEYAMSYSMSVSGTTNELQWPPKSETASRRWKIRQGGEYDHSETLHYGGWHSFRRLTTWLADGWRPVREGTQRSWWDQQEGATNAVEAFVPVFESADIQAETQMLIANDLITLRHTRKAEATMLFFSGGRAVPGPMSLAGVIGQLNTTRFVYSGGGEHMTNVIALALETTWWGGLGLAGTNGFACRNMPDGVTVECSPRTGDPTLVLAQLQGNASAGEVKPVLATDPPASQNKLRIEWSGLDATDKLTPAWVGQQMLLSSRFTPPLPPGTSAKNYDWTVPGPAYAEIDYNDQRGLVLPLTNITNSSVRYYWTKEFEKATVVCSAEVNGARVTSQASFNVRKPEVTWTLTPKYPVGVYTNYSMTSLTCLACGMGGEDTNFSGMLFEWRIPSVASLKGYTNTFFNLKMVQLVTTTIKQNFAVPIGTNLSRSVSTNGIDSGYPYSAWAPVMPPGLFPLFHDYDFAKDSPAELLDGAASYSHRTDSFTSILLFQPDGGRPVPLKAATWSWSGGAMMVEPNAPVVYQLTSSTNAQPTVGQNLDAPPTWRANIIDLVSPGSPYWTTNSTAFPIN